MNSQIRSIITDIKAAVRIGHPESFWAALEGLLNLPETLGNPPMKTAFIEKAILPIGETLANPRLKLTMLQPLLDEPQAVLRASAAAALAFRYLDQGQVTLKQLNKPAADTRQDVRLALQLALKKTIDPADLEPLVSEWLSAPSPRLQALAIALLPRQPEQALPRISSLVIHSDPQVRAALVDALIELAQGGQDQEVLTLLKDMAATDENNIWTICKSLASSWAAAFPDEVMAIMLTLHARADNPKQIINTLQALHRHGAGEEVITTLKAWRQIEDQSLNELAIQVLGKLE